MNYFKDIQNLDLWLAVDKTYEVTSHIHTKDGHTKDISFIFYKKPVLARDRFGFSVLHESGDGGNFNRIYSAKTLNLLQDYKPHKLYVLKNRYKESIRTFWLTILGYKKYIITDVPPIKRRYSIKIDNSIIGLYLNGFKCGRTRFGPDDSFCKECQLFSYCNNMYIKPAQYKKIYLYYIKNKQKVYL